MFDQKTSPVYSLFGVINWTGVAPATGGVMPSIAEMEIVAGVSPFATAEVIGAKSVITKVANRDAITRFFITNTVASQSVLLQSFDRDGSPRPMCSILRALCRIHVFMVGMTNLERLGFTTYFP